MNVDIGAMGVLPDSVRFGSRAAFAIAMAILAPLASSCGDDRDPSPMADTDEAGSAQESDGTPSVARISCDDKDFGSLTCSAPDLCCLNAQAANTCAATCDAGSTTKTCASAEDCEGRPCCGQIGGALVCSQTSTCEQSGDWQLCASAGECPADKASCCPVRLNGNSLRYCTDNAC